MLVKFLGTRGNIPVKSRGYELHSGILVDDKLMFDIGEKKYLDYKPAAIFLTHLHTDHAFFENPKESLQLTIPIYAPEDSRKKHLKIMSEPIRFGKYLITPIPTLHSNKVKSQGYLVSNGKKSIFYTGDLFAISRANISKIGKPDLVITEASFKRKGGMLRKDKTGKLSGHAGVPDLVALFKNRTGKIVFMHFGSWFVKDPPQGILELQAYSTRKLSVLAGFDGMRLNV